MGGFTKSYEGVEFVKKFFYCFFVLLFFSFYLWSTPKNNFAYILKIDGGVNPASGHYVVNSLIKAKEDGAHIVIIQLNTPGGLITSARKIVNAILKSEVPVVVYVPCKNSTVNDGKTRSYSPQDRSQSILKTDCQNVHPNMCILLKGVGPAQINTENHQIC